MNKVYHRIYFIFSLLLCINQLFSQTFTDGPIQLQIRLRDVSVGFNETDASLLGVGFGPDEPIIHFWARDAANISGQGWGGGACHAFSMGTGGSQGLPGVTPAINEMLFNFTYPTSTVPQFYELKSECFEDDNSSDQLLGFCANGSVCGFDAQQCCGIPIFGICIGLNEGDDKHCGSDPFKTSLQYRTGPPCSWFDQGFITGTCSTDWKPGIETFWRYTKGDACANSIDMGTLNSGGSIFHFNSNICYSNSHTLSAGNDVWYKFHVNQPMGITASLCGANGAQFDSYLYFYSSCAQATPDTSNDDNCSLQSALDYSICQAGDYYLVVDAKTATDTGTFTITVSDNPNFIFAVVPAVQQVSCAGGSDGQITANLQGGLPPFVYTWSNGATTATITGLVGNVTYCVTVTDTKGCNATACVQINDPAPLTATTNATPVSCGGACDGSATVVSPQGGTPPYTYAWNSLPPQQLQTATYLCAASYNVTVFDANQCSITRSATVPNTTTVVITLDSLKNVQCFSAANGGIYITSSGGQLPLGFAWSNSATTEDNTNLGPGTYTITVTDNIGCTVGDTWTITEPPLLTSSVSYTFNPNCNGDTTGIVDVTVGGGTQPYSYQWGAPTNAVSQNLNHVVAGTHTVTVSDANSCTLSQSATLTEPSAFNNSLVIGNVLCFGDSNGTATVNISGATPPYSVIWSSMDTGPTTNGLSSGPFSAVITDAHGCTSFQFGDISSPPLLHIDSLVSFAPLCADFGAGSITAYVSGGVAPYSYSWSGGLPPVSNPSAGTGNYSVTVADANNCATKGSAGVNAPEPFTVDLVGINPGCIGDSSGAVAASTRGGHEPYQYSWSTSPVDTAAFIEKVKRGFYSLTVTDVNGCTSHGEAFLEDPLTDPESCKPDKFVVLVPTAFSPNGDNTNDKLVAIMRNVEKLDFKVFNRWGELVYENLNMLPGDGWDGIYKGKEQPIGTYVYVFNVTYVNGVHAVDKGSATLIR